MNEKLNIVAQEKEVDYAYGDLSKVDTETLKRALKSYKARDDGRNNEIVEIVSRIEGELLNRKEINIRQDFVLEKPASLKKKVNEFLTDADQQNLN